MMYSVFGGASIILTQAWSLSPVKFI